MYCRIVFLAKIFFGALNIELISERHCICIIRLYIYGFFWNSYFIVVFGQKETDAPVRGINENAHFLIFLSFHRMSYRLFRGGKLDDV